MEYSQLLKGSWQATLRHKAMWWLGMAVLGGSSTMSWRLVGDAADIGLNDNGELSDVVRSSTSSPLLQLWWHDYWWMAALVVVGCFLLWVIAIMCHLIARSGLYYGARQARLGKPVRFGEMVHAGAGTFWRYIGFYLLLAVMKLAAMLLLVMNVLFLAATIIGLLFVLPLVFIIVMISMPLAMALEVFIIYSLQGITLERDGVRASMRRAWQKLRDHSWQTALAYVLIFLIKFVVMVLGLIVFSVVAAPFAILAYVAYTSHAPLGIGLSVIGGLGLLGTIGLIAKGIFYSFTSHFWHRVYAHCH